LDDQSRNGTFSANASHGFGDPRPTLLASRRHTVRFVLIVCGIALAGLLNGRQLAAASDVSHLPLYLSILFLQSLFVWFVRLGIRVHGGSLLDLVGQRWRSPLDGLRDTGLALLSVIVLRSCSALLQHFLGHSANTSFLLPKDATESVLWVAVSIAAGVSEEIVYRGYLQRQLWALGGSLPLAIVFQSLIFAAGHAYQGWRAAAITGVYGLGFGLLAAWRRSIIPGAIAHTFIDLIGGLFRR
jgi:membrane protease YdiL (CAAX protease family)